MCSEVGEEVQVSRVMGSELDVCNGYIVGSWVEER